MAPLNVTLGWAKWPAIKSQEVAINHFITPWEGERVGVPIMDALISYKLCIV